MLSDQFIIKHLCKYNLYSSTPDFGSSENTNSIGKVASRLDYRNRIFVSDLLYSIRRFQLAHNAATRVVQKNVSHAHVLSHKTTSIG